MSAGASFVGAASSGARVSACLLPFTSLLKPHRSQGANSNSENFRVLGFVEDISEYFNNAKLFVAPLAFGAGIKGKIGQSLEFSLPLLTTNIGAEGFDFSPNEELMIAPMDSPRVFAGKIIALYKNEKLWDIVSENSEKILEPFSLAKIEEHVMEILK